MKHKNFILFFAVFFFFFISFVSAIETNLTYSSSSIIQIKSLKYEPYPVNPGEYFDIWISVQCTQKPSSSGAVFELIPEYPFSLDNNESAVKNFGTTSSSSLVLKYKVRVAEDAVKGVNPLKLNYKVGDNWYTQEFDIEVSNAQTTFDAIIQDSTSSEVSIAIANTGKETANSVIVKIPTQDSFVTTGTNGQMVGNLESGDYSIVSFELSKKMSPQTSTGSKNTKTGIQGISASQSENLTFDIHYTDNIGVRRIVTMQLPLSLASSSNSSMMGFGLGMKQKNSNLVWYILIIVLVILVVAFFIVYKKFPEKTKRLLNKINPKNLFKKKEKAKIDVPDWVKKNLPREKNK